MASFEFDLAKGGMSCGTSQGLGGMGGCMLGARVYGRGRLREGKRPGCAARAGRWGKAVELDPQRRRGKGRIVLGRESYPLGSRLKDAILTCLGIGALSGIMLALVFVLIRLAGL